MSEQEKCPDCGASLIKSVPKKGAGPSRGLHLRDLRLQEGGEQVTNAMVFMQPVEPYEVPELCTVAHHADLEAQLAAARADAEDKRQVLRDVLYYLDFVDFEGTRGVPGRGTASDWAKRRREDEARDAVFEAIKARAEALVADHENLKAGHSKAVLDSQSRSSPKRDVAASETYGKRPEQAEP